MVMAKIEKVVMTETPDDPGIEGVGYKKGVPGASSPQLFARLRNGTVLTYFGVPRAAFDAALSSGDGVGSHIAKKIRPFHASAHLIESRDVIFTWKTNKAKGKAAAPKVRFTGMPEHRWQW